MAKMNKSVEKALNILEELAGGDAISLTELSQRLSYPPSTAYRLLNTLVDKNYVYKNKNLYRIGPGVLRLQALSRQNLQLEQLVWPFLVELEKQTELTTNLAIKDGLEMFIIKIINGSKNLVVNHNLGMSVPLHASALGKCLLAFSPTDEQWMFLNHLELKKYTPRTITDLTHLTQELEVTKQRGYSVDDEEFVTGIRCIGVPLLDADNRVIAAMSISGLTSQVNDATLGNYVKTAMSIGRKVSSLILLSHNAEYA